MNTERAARLHHHERRALALRRRRHHLAPDGRGRRPHSQRPGRLQLRRLRRHEESRTSSTRSARRATSRPTAARRSPASCGYGGDDPQQMWIDPTNSKRMLVGFDQGAIVTLDGGATWSSWYNQSTEQVYHLAADNSYPVLDLRDAAGRRRHPHAKPRQPRRDHSDGLESGAGMGVGHDRPRPARPERRVRERQRDREDHVSERAVDRREPGVGPEPRAAHGDSRSRSSGRRGISTSCSPGFQYLMATTDGGVHWRKLSPDLGLPPNAAAPRSRTAPATAAPPSARRRDRVDLRVHRGARARSGSAPTTG